MRYQAPAIFQLPGGQTGQLYSLPELAQKYPGVARLPVSIRIMLESLLRHHDGKTVTDAHIEQLAHWQPQAERVHEIPFTVARVVLQDFTGVPLLVDLAAMRSAAARLGHDPKQIEPLVPVDLVVDHSVMVDYFGRDNALDLNMQLEFRRNHERYAFLKWGMQAFERFQLVPPGFGIVHQVNLEYLAPGVHHDGNAADAVYYPDTLVGTDSHTTMINGIGVVGWGVGGIEAEAAMLGQPVYLLTPDVVGFELRGKLRPGVTATDLVLTVTQILRQHKVVGKFVEFFGEGVRALAVPDRATISNMAPEYGATMGFFPVDERTVDYLRATGRSDAEVDALRAYFQAQHMFGIPLAGELDYSETIVLDLDTVDASMAGPKRPQDRVALSDVAHAFTQLLTQSTDQNGFNLPADQIGQRHPVARQVDSGCTAPEAPSVPEGSPRMVVELGAASPQKAANAGNPDQVVPTDSYPLPADVGHGDVLIAAITSCTNTSNPSVMLAAGLLARKAVSAGLKVQPHIKTSLAPGSRLVTEYLQSTGLLPYLEQLGFALAGYGCTTCIGNSGDLAPEINTTINQHQLVCAAVLSGNRNFEARIHPQLKANYLASPPLVVAYAIAGSLRHDMQQQPLGHNASGQAIFLRDIWPSDEEIQALAPHAMRAARYRDNYHRIQTEPGALWEQVAGSTGVSYNWVPSTYIAEPPFFDGFSLQAQAGSDDPSVRKARILALFGDSITTDHISPAGSIKVKSPAGAWLQAQGVTPAAFNSYGSRRGHHEVMMRGTFANVRIKNLMLPQLAGGSREEGGITLLQPGGERMSIYDAAMRYQASQIPTVVLAGEEYGTGSSRDWAAKGTYLLGVRAVVARSFERIHRSNLIGMGVLPLQFQGTESWQSLGLTGAETVDVVVDPALEPRSAARLIATRANGEVVEAALTLRIDTPIEADYYRAGGILPFVLRSLLAG